MKLLQIYFRLNGHDYKGTAFSIELDKKGLCYVVNIPGLRKDMTIIAENSEDAWLAWKDYDTQEESMLIEMIGKAIERAL
ncbi:MAG: hypothetical protein ACTHLE_13800 [Agriterribacter sp.]